MFYDNYLNVCEKMGISPTRVLEDIGISKSSYGHWKKGGEPLNETKKKIADHFGIDGLANYVVILPEVILLGKYSP